MMIKRFICFLLISAFLFFNTGCALLKLALAAGAAYGISQAMD